MQFLKCNITLQRQDTLWLLRPTDVQTPLQSRGLAMQRNAVHTRQPLHHNDCMGGLHATS
jgi:hypothetical protein